MRNLIIKIVTFLAGLYFFLEWIIPDSVLVTYKLNALHEKISDGFILVGSMSIGLGIINLVTVYGAKIVYKRKDYFYSYALMLGLVVMLVVSIIDWRADIASKKNVNQLNMLSKFSKVIVSDVVDEKEGVLPFEKRVKFLKDDLENTLSEIEKETKLYKENEKIKSTDRTKLEKYSVSSDELIKKIRESLVSIETNDNLRELSKSLQELSALHFNQTLIHINYTNVKRAWTLLFNGLFVALGSAMFSILGVYIASAAYRAFRISSFESAFMLFAALLVMLGQIPFGEYILKDMPAIRGWLLEVPNTAAFRAIRIGAAIAGLVLAYRMWFSIESEYGEKS